MGKPRERHRLFRSVATMSAALHDGRSARQRAINAPMYVASRNSRPVDLGGGAAKYGCASNSSITSTTGDPIAAIAPSTSKAMPG
jgi:hypothetical protein